MFATSSMRWEAQVAKPGVVEAELHAVALEAHDELLPGSDAQRFAVAGEPGFGVGDEPTRLLLDGAPDAGVREQLGERDDAVALGRELGEDVLLHLVELRL